MVENLELFHKTMLFCVNTVGQKACVAALTGYQKSVHEMVAEYDWRKKFLYGALKGIQKIFTFPCEGAFLSPVLNLNLSAGKRWIILLKNRY